MLYGLFCAIRIVAYARAHALGFVGRNAHTHPAAAEQNTAVGLLGSHHFGYFVGIVGVIGAFATKRAAINYFVPQAAYNSRYGFFQRKARVIASYCYFHKSVCLVH